MRLFAPTQKKNGNKIAHHGVYVSIHIVFSEIKNTKFDYLPPVTWNCSGKLDAQEREWRVKDRVLEYLKKKGEKKREAGKIEMHEVK